MKDFHFNIRLLLSLLLILSTGNIPVQAQSRDVVVHDPVMIKQNDTYYAFHTGNGIHVKSSKDLKTGKKKNLFLQTRRNG